MDALSSAVGRIGGLLGISGPSARDRRLLEAPIPEGERCFGFDNFGNTCYANSVLQGLYQCQPFRLRMLDLASDRRSGRNDGGKARDDTVSDTLASLFEEIKGQKRRVGTVAPKRFIHKIKQEWEQFRSYDEHQDAHELLINLLNVIGEQLEEKQRSCMARPASSSSMRSSKGSSNSSDSAQSAGGPHSQQSQQQQQKQQPSSWLHELFEGREVHETTCLCCDTTTRREEPFIVLSLPVIQNSSIAHSLDDLSAVTTLQGDEKFECNECGTYKEAQRRTRLSHLPPVLLLHLKRFKTTTHLDRDGFVRAVKSKLLYRVVFPFSFKMGDVCSVEGPQGADTVYTLFAVIVHVGSGMDHGHYMALVKSGEVWLQYEDECVDVVSPSYVATFFGGSYDLSNNVGHGYILMYQQMSHPQVSAAISTSHAKAHTTAKGHS